jgi:hypothetical protein
MEANERVMRRYVSVRPFNHPEVMSTLVWVCFVSFFDQTTLSNEYEDYLLEGKGRRYVELTTLPRSCSDGLEILEP